jgi:hypothetical protein
VNLIILNLFIIKLIWVKSPHKIFKFIVKSQIAAIKLVKIKFVIEVIFATFGKIKYRVKSIVSNSIAHETLLKIYTKINRKI